MFITSPTVSGYLQDSFALVDALLAEYGSEDGIKPQTWVMGADMACCCTEAVAVGLRVSCVCRLQLTHVAVKPQVPGNRLRLRICHLLHCPDACISWIHTIHGGHRHQPFCRCCHAAIAPGPRCASVVTGADARSMQLRALIAWATWVVLHRADEQDWFQHGVIA